MNSRPSPAIVRLGAAAAILALGACTSDTDPSEGTEGTGGTSGTEWPAPYGTELDADAVDSLCGVPTNQVADTYVSHDPDDRQQAGTPTFADDVAAPRQDAARSATGGPAPRRASAGARTLVPPQEGAITDVTVELVSEPSDPTFAVDVTLSGPDDEAEYTAESAHVSFLSVDSEQRWVGFPLVDGELDGSVGFDAPITVTSDGSTGRLEVVPVACPTGDGTWTAAPLPDGEYDLSVYGTADALGEVDTDEEPYPGSPVIGVWGQEHTRVSVTDGVISGIGYDGPNAYDSN